MDQAKVEIGGEVGGTPFTEAESSKKPKKSMFPMLSALGNSVSASGIG